MEQYSFTYLQQLRKEQMDRLALLEQTVVNKVDPEDLGVFATNGQFSTVASDLNTLNKDITDNKPAKGTSTQTVTGKMRVLIPHGIPTNAAISAINRTLKLNAVTEAASNYIKAAVDDTNIIIDYDVAVNSGTNGWIMQWEL